MCIKSILTYTNYIYAIHPTPKGVGFSLYLVTTKKGYSECKHCHMRIEDTDE